MAPTLPVLVVILFALAALDSRRARARARRPTRTASFDAEGAHSYIGEGERADVAWESLCQIDILTTDEGPLVDDVWWLLRGKEGERCVISSEAIEPLVAELSRLHGVDFGAIIDASGSCVPAIFHVWKGNPGDAAAMRDRFVRLA